MKFILIILLTAIGTSHAGVNEFATWTTNSNSVQAIVYNSLERSLRIDNLSQWPQKMIVRKDKALIISNDENTLTCEAKSLGLIMVVSYRCTIKGVIKNWTENAASVQAVLFDALTTELEEDSKADYPRKLIYRKGSAVILKDQFTAVVCGTMTRGMAQVQSYACQIK